MWLVVNVTGLRMRHVVTLKSEKGKEGDNVDIKYIFIEFVSLFLFCP